MVGSGSVPTLAKFHVLLVGIQRSHGTNDGEGNDLAFVILLCSFTTK